MGLEVDSSDVEELVGKHIQELEREELVKLPKQRRMSPGRYHRGNEEQSSSAIKEMLQLWESVLA